MRRRLPRRQGVVYGPLARQEGPESGGVLGRILGAVVVVAAVGVLAFAGMNFLGAGGAVPPGSPTPTSGGLASPTRSPSPTPRATATPTPTATPGPTPTASPSPSPTPIAIEVREGPGFVTLGSNYRTDPARIVDPSATFGSGERIAWMADLDGPAGSTQVDIVVARVGEGGSETPTYEQVYEPNSANSSVFLRRFRNIGQLIDGAGTYVVRYIVAGDVRAEGYFRVEAD